MFKGRWKDSRERMNLQNQTKGIVGGIKDLSSNKGWSHSTHKNWLGAPGAAPLLQYQERRK